MVQRRKGTHLSVQTIREWCESHWQRTGRFPASTSGPVREEPEITWLVVNRVLRSGGRHLPGDSTLARFLREQFNTTDRRGRVVLTPELILKWADAHFERTGRWPAVRQSHLPQYPVPESPGDNWRLINVAMHHGHRGYKGPPSLRALLSKERGEKYRHWLAPLSVKQIIQWAENHRTRTGSWPNYKSGVVSEAPSSTWSMINESLVYGKRGLVGGNTLAQLIARLSHAKPLSRTSRLTIEQILRWADAHRRRNGQWPHIKSGPVHEAPHENWRAIHTSLYNGRRGLQERCSLPQLLAKHRGAPSRRPSHPITILQILAWADAHHKRTGAWPMRNSGPTGRGAKGTWGGIDNALKKGLRGLRKSSLASVLMQFRKVRRGINSRLASTPAAHDDLQEEKHV